MNESMSCRLDKKLLIFGLLLARYMVELTKVILSWGFITGNLDCQSRKPSVNLIDVIKIDRIDNPSHFLYQFCLCIRFII